MRICFVAPRLPWPTVRGDALRVYHQIRALGQEHAITLVCTTDEAVESGSLSQIEPFCEQVVTVPLNRLRSFANVFAGAVASHLPLQVSYYRSPAFAQTLAGVFQSKRFDVVHTSFRMAPYLWTGPSAPVVMDLVDSSALNIATRMSRTAPLFRPAYELEQRRAKAYEREICRHFREVVVCSPADRDAIGEPNITVIPNGVDTDAFAFSRNGRDSNTIVFVGNMGYHPNVDAAVWFAESVWPTLKRSRPNLKLLIVGARPAPAVSALASRFPDVVVTGLVPSVLEYLHKGAIAICPLRCGSGMQNKVLEAMAAGTPIVATSIANLAIGARNEKELMVADRPEAFAAAVSALLDAPKRRETIADNARAFVEAFSWRQHARAFNDVYRRIIAAG
jgi:sugar transferase (PEP-CTERM/EpsH1 system associated)